jgi:hypothetical protein
VRIGTPDYESAVRFAAAVWGDADNPAAIIGSVCQALWGVPRAIREQSLAIAARGNPGWSLPRPISRPSLGDIDDYMVFWPSGLTVNKFS